MKQPMYECPKFGGCSAASCPLDVATYSTLAIDERCTATKRVRYRIGSKYPDILPWRGLNGKEYGSLRRVYGEGGMWGTLNERYLKNKGKKTEKTPKKGISERV